MSEYSSPAQVETADNLGQDDSAEFMEQLNEDASHCTLFEQESKQQKILDQIRADWNELKPLDRRQQDKVQKLIEEQCPLREAPISAIFPIHRCCKKCRKRSDENGEEDDGDGETINLFFSDRNATH